MIGQLPLEIFRVRFPCPFGQKIHRDGSKPLLIGRILLKPAAEGKMHRDKRKLMILDQPCGDARTARHFLYIGGARRSERQRKSSDDNKDEANGKLQFTPPRKATKSPSAMNINP
jgi:hypothetical protein